MVWAVGDVHGRSDLLKPLLSLIKRDLKASQAQRKVLVMLGDYVDRGPDSRGVLDQLARLRGQDGLETRYLCGNHEDRMLAFLGDPALGPGWCDFGGREALLSYGVRPPVLRDDPAGWSEASEELGRAMPPAHRRLLETLELATTLGDYFFCHAGARPGVPLAQQSPDDLMWIRQPFLDDPAPFEQVVVHGHTPIDAVHADHRRIGLDTGAYATGVLSALRLEGEERRLAQTAMTAGRITVSERPL